MTSREEQRTHFELRAGEMGFGKLSVVSFRGRERISRPYAFDIVARAPRQGFDEASFEASCLGRDACLRIAVPEGLSRFVSGVVSRVRQEGVFEGGQLAYRLRLEPRLSLCRLNQRSRVFQEKTLSEIVSLVLSGHGIACRFDLLGPRHRRAYCVQHAESDLAFVERICAEAGVFYHFEHPEADSPGAREVVVFGDAPALYPKIMGSEVLVLRRSEGGTALQAREDQVTSFTRSDVSATEGVLVRDHDFRRPTAELRAEAGSRDGLVVYEHHGEDEEPEIDPARAKALLEQRRARATVAKGETHCRRLSPGLRFTLEDHEIASQNGGWVVVRAAHEGHDPQHSGTGKEVFSTRFQAIPSSVAARPKKPRKKLRQVMETATVVGPPGQEIHTDSFGRIKVQFHWDLEGERDEFSSCFLRVTQGWSGAGFGFQFVPRVGAEVLVGFIGGDLDRPVVLGSLHDATHPPPFQLPEEKTRSGIRSHSTPASGGYNEISFEDQSGAEEVFVRAQRDLREAVENDHDETVRNDKSVTIGGRHLLRVQGDRDDHVAGMLVQKIDGGASVSVGGHSTSVLEGDVGQEVRGSVTETVNGSDKRTVYGDRLRVVMGQSVVKVEAEHALLVGEGRDDGVAETHVSSKWLVSSGRTAHVTAAHGIRLSVGDSVVEIGPDRIVLRAARVEIEGQESASMVGKGPALRLGDEAEIVGKTVRLYGEKSSIELDRDASVKGTRVLLNCKNGRPKDPTREAKEPETVPLRIQLTNANFEPYAGKLYDISCEDYKAEGVTGPDGVVHEEVPKGAQTARITLWLGEDRTGPKRVYSISLGALPDIGSVAGVRVRLGNLGYGDGAGRGELDPKTREAIAHFQRDHALPETGEIDEATKTKLREAHGS